MSRKNSHRAPACLSTFLALLATLIAGAPALAVAATEPSEPSPPTETFLESVDVHVVNVEAVVTDLFGQRIEDLGPDDFRLLVDGQEMPIAYFTEIRNHRVVAPASLADGTGGIERKPTTTLPAALEVDRPAPVRYLVFFDEVFTSGRDRRLMAREIEHHVDRLGPDDTMTLVAFDGGTPEILVDDSGDPRVLRSGLLMAGEDRFFRGGNRRAEMDFFRASGLDENRSFAPGSMTGSTEFDDDITAAQLERLIDRESDRVFEALAVSMRRLARDAEPGRRVLLWVTGGWPIEPSISRQPVLGPDRPGEKPEQEFDRGRRLERFSRLASRLGFTVYPIDAPGWQIKGLDKMSAASGSMKAVNQYIASTRPTSYHEYEVHATFETMAEITGGQAYLNSFRRDALERVIEDVGSYYWLGFDAPWASDGEEHRIELEAKRPGLQVRTRTGVWAAPRDRLRALDVLAARIESPKESIHGLGVHLGEIVPVENNEIRVPIALDIPVEDFGALPIEAGFELRFEARLVAIDGRGRRSDPIVQPVVVGGSREPAAGDVARYEAEALLPDGTERVLVSIHDLLGESTLLAAADL